MMDAYACKIQNTLNSIESELRSYFSDNKCSTILTTDDFHKFRAIMTINTIASIVNDYSEFGLIPQRVENLIRAQAFVCYEHENKDFGYALLHIPESHTLTLKAVIPRGNTRNEFLIFRADVYALSETELRSLGETLIPQIRKAKALIDNEGITIHHPPKEWS